MWNRCLMYGNRDISGFMRVNPCLLKVLHIIFQVNILYDLLRLIRSLAIIKVY